MIKRWVVRAGATNRTKAVASQIAKRFSLHELAATLLANRGYDLETAAEFLGYSDDEDYQLFEGLEDPFALCDMDLAVNRINKAVNDGESIAVYGDYDCDGVTSTVLLYSYLRSIGANVTYYIPSRFGEGYGMNRSAIKKLSEQGVRLIITVDNGINAIAESVYIKELGMELIVTDHHKPTPSQDDNALEQAADRLPTAVAVINPHRVDCKSRYKPLAGVGVVFKLVAALEGGMYETTLEQFADIAAVGTIADIVPLTGENRIIVTYGLKLLNNSSSLGVKALTEVAGVKGSLDSRSVAYMVAPRINASGRMGSASLSVKLLLAEDPDKALGYATKINELNILRQETERRVLDDIDGMIAKNPRIIHSRSVCFFGEGWHHGVIGIVAARVVQRYGKPTFLMCEDEGIVVGSARGLNLDTDSDNVSIYELLSSCSDILLRYGGHTAAGGFSLRKEDVPAFISRIEEFLSLHYDIMPYPTIYADLELSSRMLQLEQFEQLSLLEPFGQKNDPPVFVIRGARILGITPLSQDKHQRLMLQVGQERMTALFFGVSFDRLIYSEGDSVDVICTVDISEYNGNRSLCAKVIDLRACGVAESDKKITTARLYYEKLKRRERLPEAVLQRCIPTKQECRAVFRYLTSVTAANKNPDMDELYLPLFKSGVNYCKYRIILDIFTELKILSLNNNGYGFTIDQTVKTDLERSKIYRHFAIDNK